MKQFIKVNIATVTVKKGDEIISYEFSEEITFINPKYIVSIETHKLSKGSLSQIEAALELGGVLK